MVNVSVDEGTNEVIINADAGRARRPLLVVEDGETLVSDDEIQAVNDDDTPTHTPERLLRLKFPDREEFVEAFCIKVSVGNNQFRSFRSSRSCNHEVTWRHRVARFEKAVLHPSSFKRDLFGEVERSDSSEVLTRADEVCLTR